MTQTTIDDFLKDVLVLAVVCNQWGDTGKGKVVDLFTGWSNIVVRGTGGANAGHTIVLGGQEFIFHLVPSGILYDAQGKINVVGNGVAFNPGTFIEELGYLDEHRQSYDRLKVSHRAKLLMPQHVVMDCIGEMMKGTGRVGTTGRGIGPCYKDHYDRIGLVVNDMLNVDTLREKLKKNLESKLRELKCVDPEKIHEAMDRLGLGEFYKKDGKYAPFDIDALIDKFREYGKRLNEMIGDTDDLVKNSLSRGLRVLLEGAQGLLLSIDYGTYPYVTSSDCSIEGLVKGAGLTMRDVDLTLGIVKAPFMTRVGDGPFPSEFGGYGSEIYCAAGAEHDIFYEAKQFLGCDVNLERVRTLQRQRKKEELKEEYRKVVKHIKEHESDVVKLMNSHDPFLRGVGTRLLGMEYGATTSRPRRTAALDLPLLRYAMQFNGPELALTKLDVYNQCERIPICTHYIYQGPDHRVGIRTLRRGDRIDVAIPDAEVLRYCEAQYKMYAGWMQDISGCRSYDELPGKLLSILNDVEKETGGRIRIASVGKERDATILRAA